MSDSGWVPGSLGRRLAEREAAQAILRDRLKMPISMNTTFCLQGDGSIFAYSDDICEQPCAEHVLESALQLPCFPRSHYDRTFKQYELCSKANTTYSDFILEVFSPVATPDRRPSHIIAVSTHKNDVVGRRDLQGKSAIEFRFRESLVLARLPLHSAIRIMIPRSNVLRHGLILPYFSATANYHHTTGLTAVLLLAIVRIFSSSPYFK
ncbi:hypothetical protein KCV07_g371, partial [Aureobasidium melanogenum]